MSPPNLDAALAGRYRIERELGAGGMATVYVAEDLRHHRHVAVKVVRPDLAANLGADRFLREIEIAAKLSHPHILPLYDSGGEGDVLFYIMPLVEGQSLRDRLAAAGALPIDEAVRVIREVADALAYSHQRGVVHRDIKPENILLSGAHALVTDFGVAKAVSDAVSAATLTSTGVTLGTPAYMAPEQATADPQLDHRADIYALGVMAYEIVAGVPPFTGNAQQVIAGHLTKTPDPISTHRPSVPAAVAAVIMRCLEKDPAHRWQSADDVVRALDAAATTAAVRPPSRARRPVVIAAVATLMLAAAGFSWFARSGRAGTLIGDDVLSQNDLVLVSELENSTADSSLGGAVTDAIRAELQQSSAVRVVSQAAMFAGLARMGLGQGSFLPQPKVQELAEREGAKAFVVGKIARVGGGYQITARVVATHGGSETLIAAETASDSTKLIAAVGNVGRKLRREIGESIRSVMSAPALAAVTTASLPALRAYSASLRAEAEGQRPRAISLAKEALSIDTAFAAAWGALFVTYSNMGLVRPATEAAARAYALRERLSEVERLRIEAGYHATRGDAVAAEAALIRLAEFGRGEIGYSDMLLGMGRLTEAEAMARRAVASNPTTPVAYWNLAEAQVAQHRFAAADSTAAMIATRLPESAYRYFIPAAILWGRRDLKAVEAYLGSADAPYLANARWNQCLLDLHRGRISAWQRCPTHDDLVAANPSLAIAEFRMTGNSVRPRAVYEPFLAKPRDERNPDLYAEMIALLADVGRMREARQLLDEWRERAGPRDRGFQADSGLAVGAVAAAEGQWDRSVAAFLAWNKAPRASAQHVYNRGLPEAAAILRRRGQPDSAIALLERALSTSSLFGGSTYEAAWYAQSLAWLGELYEARRDFAKAAEYYRTYVDVLADADAPIATQVAAVRERLARLTAGRQ